MKVLRTQAEKEQISKLFNDNYTFMNVFKKDFTNNVMNDLHYRMHGRIPRNFLINISGLIGTPTGIFKSTLGVQIALSLDKTFNLKTRVAFTINDLIEKIQDNTELKLTKIEYESFKKSYKGSYEVYQKYGDDYDYDVLLTKLIFFLDEQTRTLKTGSIIRLQNLVDTCRQRQICFITCGVDSYDFNFSTYDLLRVQETHDQYLPKKIVHYAVYDRARDIYYGYFKWNIWELTQQFWNNIFSEYSQLKTDFQRRVLSQQISTMDYDNYADEIMGLEEFSKCFSFNKDGSERFLSSLCKALIIKTYPDFTNQERDTILSEIKFKLADD